jgi:DNA-binding Lrp family transcriptional regulator
MQLDRMNLQILGLLQEDGRRTYVDVARGDGPGRVRGP